MVSALVSGSSRPGSSPGWGHCVVFLGKTLYSHSALSTQVYKQVPTYLMLGVTLRWTGIPSRREQKYSQSLHATEIGDKRRPDGPLGPNADFFTYSPKHMQHYSKLVLRILHSYSLTKHQHCWEISATDYLKALGVCCRLTEEMYFICFRNLMLVYNLTSFLTVFKAQSRVPVNIGFCPGSG